MSTQTYIEFKSYSIYILDSIPFYCSISKDFMEQLHQGLSDSTPKAGSDRSTKSLLSALQLISIRQISTQKYGSIILTLFYSAGEPESEDEKHKEIVLLLLIFR